MVVFRGSGLVAPWLKGEALRRVGRYWQDCKRAGLDEATVRRALELAEQDERERARREKKRAS